MGKRRRSSTRARKSRRYRQSWGVSWREALRAGLAVALLIGAGVGVGFAMKGIGLIAAPTAHAPPPMELSAR